jgi:two-component system, chemotaxis family, chemotaxis protein CheY
MVQNDTVSPRLTIRILIVDDSSLVRLYYRNILERAGFEVERVQAQAFNLVVVDVNMPKMDGFSFLRALRRSAPSVATLPALVITTESSQHDLDDARSAGANFYLVKPVSEADLLRHAAILTGKQDERIA